MAAAALLATKPRPTDQDINEAMDGNLCRCGTYLRIRAAVHKAAAMMPAPPAPKPAEKKKAPAPPPKVTPARATPAKAAPKTTGKGKG